MPYPSLDSLPDGVKKALPREAQEIWRNAANSALQKGGDEEKAAKIAWGAVKNAGWKQDADGNWKKSNTDDPPAYDLDAEIFSAGTWNGDKYTEKDLDAMVEAFEKLGDQVKPPVKLGHNEQQMADGNPALGWVSSLKRVGNKLVARLSNVPEIVYKAIKGGRYKRVSSEIFWNYRDQAGKQWSRVLAGVALLGADLPAVSNLKDLEAYLSQSILDGSFDRKAVYSFDVGDAGSIQPDENDKRRKKQMSDELKDKIRDLESRQKELEKELEAEKKKNADLEHEKKTYAEREAEARKTAKADEFKAYMEQQVKDGKVTPAARDILVKAMEDPQKHTYTEDGGFAFSATVMQEYTKVLGETLPKGEAGEQGKGDDFDSAKDELHTKALKMSAESAGRLDYTQAVSAVLSSDQDLAKRYKDETDAAIAKARAQ